MPKIALVTGANRGLGFEVARQLAQAGSTVVIGARDTEKGDEAAELLRSEGLDAESLGLDVASAVSVKAAVQEVSERHGRLDILINNAGILPEATATDATTPLDLALFRDTFETNVFGAAAVTQEFLPLLRQSEAGRIVNVSSTQGSLNGQSDSESEFYQVVLPAYNASKSALNQITVALSKLLADTPIKVNSICPGWVQTDLGGPDNRAAAPRTPAEAAQIVIEMALIADDGPTGQFVDRNGAVAW